MEDVVEKVGIDLFLKQPQLQLLLGAGVLLHFFHQALEFCRHAVEAPSLRTASISLSAACRPSMVLLASASWAFAFFSSVRCV